MAIQASDVRAAYASPIDFGAQLQQIQKDKEQKQLLEEERAQKQEDRDIRRAQALSEIEQPLYETTGTLYDDYKNSAINNFHTKDFIDYMKQNPNASYADQYRFTQSRLNGIRQNMESAKLAQRNIEQGVKYLSSNFAGINESTLAKKLAEETFKPNGEPASSIDVNKIKDRISELELHPELMADYYDRKKGLASLITDASKLSTDGSDVVQWKGGYKSVKYIKDVERLNTQTGEIELNTDYEKVPITKVVNGVSTTVQQDVPLLNQKAFDKLASADLKKSMDIGLPHIHKMLEQDPEQKQLMDNMNETQLHRYLGAVYLHGANFGSDSKDVTQTAIDANNKRVREETNFNYEQNKRKEEKPLLALEIDKANAGDIKSLSNFQQQPYKVGGVLDDKNQAHLVSWHNNYDGEKGLINTGTGKTYKVFITDNGTKLIQPMRKTVGKNPHYIEDGDAKVVDNPIEWANIITATKAPLLYTKAPPKSSTTTTNTNTLATPTNDASKKEAMRKALEKLHEKGNKKDDKKG